jgi:hypothetical protein
MGSILYREDLVRRFLTALAVAAGLGGTPLLAQQPGQGMPCMQGMQGMGVGMQDTLRRQRMEQMQAQMQERDERLERQMAKVDSARGDAKMKAMAEAIRMMVADRREMHLHMQEHMQRMGQMGQDGCSGPAGMGPHGPHPMPGRMTGE